MPQGSECLIAGGGKSSDLMDSPLGLVLLDVLLESPIGSCVWNFNPWINFADSRDPDIGAAGFSLEAPPNE